MPTTSMKGLILAGGRGSRLRPFSHATPKHLVPVANTPVVEFGLSALRTAGVTEVAIVVSPASAPPIRDHVGDGSSFGLEVSYVEQGTPRGLGHAVATARDFVGTDPFLVYFGDTIVDERLLDTLVDVFDPGTHSAGLLVQAVEEPSRFGIVELENGAVTAVHEKPAAAPTNLAYVGALAFTPAVFEYIDGLEPSQRGELELTEAIDHMARAGDAIAHRVVDGRWLDVGTPADVVTANRRLLEDVERTVAGDVAPGATVVGPVDVDTGATVEAGTTVRGPASIGAGATIEHGARVGPYASVGEDCVVAEASVASSVLCPGATIRSDERVVDSLVGHRASVVGHREDDDGTRYVLGADASLER